MTLSLNRATIRPRMEAKQMTIGSETSAVIVVDPLYDFGTPEGEFVKCYGIEDSKPVMRAIQELRESLLRLQGSARLILCRSNYTHNQFGVPGLERLCTTDQGRASLIERTVFDDEFMKTDNSIFSADRDMEAELAELSDLVLCGVTTTSCVVKSFDDIRAKVSNLRLIIPRQHVASRSARLAEEDRLLSTWSKESEGRVVVVPSLDRVSVV